MSTIERYELKKLTSETLGNIDKRPGVYAVYCTRGSVVKFGRASNLRERLKTYDDMCLASGGVVIFIKYVAGTMISLAEKAILSFAINKLKLVARDEYFSIDCEQKAQMIMEYSLMSLFKNSVSEDAIWELVRESLDNLYMDFHNDPSKGSYGRLEAEIKKFVGNFDTSFYITPTDFKQIELPF